MDWFKIEIIYPRTVNLSANEDESEQEWRIPKDEDIYATEIGYFNLVDDPIAQLNPRSFIPKDGKNRKQFTEVVFLSGNVSYAVGKPDDIYTKIKDFLSSSE